MPTVAIYLTDEAHLRLAKWSTSKGQGIAKAARDLVLQGLAQAAVPDAGADVLATLERIPSADLDLLGEETGLPRDVLVKALRRLEASGAVFSAELGKYPETRTVYALVSVPGK